MGLRTSLKKNERFYFRLRLFRRITNYLFILIIIAFVLFRLDFQRIASFVNNHNQLIIAILTLVYVTTTLYYAWVTLKMLRQMQENRKSELRPVLWVEVDKPKIEKEEEMKDFERNFVTTIRISNYSRNPAIKLGIEIVIPWKEEENSPHYASHRPRKDIPGLLGPGAHYESLVNMYMHVFDYTKYADGFLSVKILYEDMDRNRYSFEQLYDLQVSPFQEKTFYYLPLKYESLYYNPSFMGKRLREEARSGVSKENTYVQIFKRGSL